MAKIDYTLDNGLHINGVNQDNPVIYDNDQVVDTPELWYLWLKANRKEVNLVGVVSSLGHAAGSIYEKQPKLFDRMNEVYNYFNAMGGKYVPPPTLGASRNLTNGSQNYENNAGSDLYITEAKKASPSKPLVIFVGGQATTVANAVLKDASIIPNIIVFHTDGFGASDYNAIDRWACEVLIDKGVKYVNWDGNLNSWYNKAGSPMYSSSNKMPGVSITGMPANSWTNYLKANWWTQGYNGNTADAGNIGDAPPVLYFFNHSLWQDVQRKNKPNVDTTADNFSFLLIKTNKWNDYGPQWSAVICNPENYVPATTDPDPGPDPEPGYEYEVKAGVTRTLSPGEQARVIKNMEQSVANKLAVFDFEIPQGVQGIPGPPGSGSGGGSISLGIGYTNVMDHGATGDGNTDDAPAFTKAWNSVADTGGKMYIPTPNNFYRFNSTFHAKPVGGNQVQVSIEQCNAKYGKWIRYFGPGNATMMNAVGWKNCYADGLRMQIEPGGGRANVQVIDFHSEGSANSLTGVCVRNVYFNLGDGTNQGFRFDKVQGGNGDISLFNFYNCCVYGTTKPGQFAFQSLGPNVLAMCVFGGFTAQCDGIFSNLSDSGQDGDRGGATWYFYGPHTSGNLCNFHVDREGTFGVYGGRFEHDKQILRTAAGSNGNIAFGIYDVRADGLQGQIMYEVNKSMSLQIMNCHHGPKFTDFIKINTDNFCQLRIEGGASRYTNLINRVGGSKKCKVYMSGHGRWVDDGTSRYIEDYVPDINGVMH